MIFSKDLKKFDRQIKCVEDKIEQVDKKVTKKIDQLSQKIANIYETNTTQLILNRLRADHNLDIPYMPTNRSFNENYSTRTNDFFHHFRNELENNYEDLWTNNREDLLVSIRPQQIEFDILDFSFEHSSKPRTLPRTIIPTVGNDVLNGYKPAYYGTNIHRIPP